MLAVHGKLNPSVADWNAYCALTAACLTPHDVQGITVTVGAGPNARQRNQVSTIHKQIGVPADAKGCVITDSALVRGVVTAFTWAGVVKRIRAFPLRDLFKGFEYVSIDQSEHMNILSVLQKLGEEIADGNPVLDASNQIAQKT